MCGFPKKTISRDGFIITFRDIENIQEDEGRIRKQLHSKGLRAKYHFEHIVGNSRIMKETIQTARKYAHAESNVFIHGETGTGKELFAQSIHNASSRRNGPFVALNCAALPESLLESELFGYMEGAFTGAIKGGKPACLSLPIMALCFSMKSEIWLSIFRQDFCESFRNGKSCVLAEAR